MRLRFEDVLDAPDLYLGQLAEWLGVSTAAANVAAMRHPERSPFAHPGPPNACGGHDGVFLDAPSLQQAARTLGTGRPRVGTRAGAAAAGAALRGVSDELARYRSFFGYG